MDKRTCKHCGITFDEPNGKVFSNHVRWCDKNPGRNNLESVADANRAAIDKRFGKLTEFKVNCAKCDGEFTVQERDKQFPKKAAYFCSRSCANSKQQSEDTKRKIKQSLDSKYVGSKKATVCLHCNKTVLMSPSENRIYCSVACRREHNRCTDEFYNYRKACEFKFNVWDYPEEFDLKLIYEHGWYKPKNKGNNLGGISRDHKISVSYGWNNAISAELLSHPANCKLMIHSANISKHSKCSVALDELKASISAWNEKYRKS